MNSKFRYSALAAAATGTFVVFFQPAHKTAKSSSKPNWTWTSNVSFSKPTRTSLTKIRETEERISIKLGGIKKLREEVQELKALVRKSRKESIYRCRPIVVCGPSGAGKSTLIKRLIKKFPGNFGFSVSHTTRDPRPGEIDGLDYHYTTVEEMTSMIEAGKFVETARVHVRFHYPCQISISNFFFFMKIFDLTIF